MAGKSLVFYYPPKCSQVIRFFMRMEGKFADIDDAARRVFAKLVRASARLKHGPA